MTNADKFQIPSNEHLMREQDAASFLGYSPRSLQRFRVEGSGPIYRRLGKRRVMYCRADLLAWTDSRQFTSTSAEDRRRAA